MDAMFDRDYDYIDFDDSGSENNESSEDEIDILLQGTPERKVKLSRRRSSSGDVQGGDEESSEDEFEKEMNKELDDHVASLEAQRKSLKDGNTSHISGIRNSTEEKESAERQSVHDEVYFDSDEEEMVEGEKRQRKPRPVLSNDDLLYDPDMDEDNQRWVDNRRQSYQPSPRQSDGQSTSGQHNNNKKKRLPNSDAVLDCPACMTTLCLDCQRHSVYSNQYRAMFVSHCTVDLKEVLKYPKETVTKKNSKRKKKSKFTRTDDTVPEPEAADFVGDNTEFDTYHPVRCTECNTLVAMYDKDEIYHFFNVLSSYS